jgi:hypothetical protein
LFMTVAWGAQAAKTPATSSKLKARRFTCASSDRSVRAAARGRQWHRSRRTRRTHARGGRRHEPGIRRDRAGRIGAGLSSTAVLALVRAHFPLQTIRQVIERNYRGRAANDANGHRAREAPHLYPPLSAGTGGLRFDSVALLDHVRGIDASRVSRRMGTLTAEQRGAIVQGRVHMLVSNR